MPVKTDKSPKKKLTISRTSKERLNGQDVLTLADCLDEIIPKDQQSYSINGEKSIDQKKTLYTIAERLREGTLRTTYLYSKSSASHGRQYAKGSISVQSLSRVLRHTLCRDTYRDFDIVNCHPTIALQYCEKRGWNVPFLRAYVNDRATHLEDLMTKNNTSKDDIKTMILAVLNGGRKLYYDTKVKTEWLNGLYNEINEVFVRIMDEPEHEGLVEEVKRIKAEKAKKDEKIPIYEIRRSVCNRVWVDIENDILNTCLDWCESNGISIEFVVLMFDGFMLPKTECMPEDWATKLSDFVFEKIGFRMGFTEKEMDEGVDISKFKAKNLYAEPVGEVDEGTIIDFIMMNTDAKLAEVCRQSFGNKYRYDGSTLFVFRNHRWWDNGMTFIFEDAKTLDRLIKPLTEAPEFADKDGMRMINGSLKYIGLQKNIKNMLQFLYPSICDKEFPSRLDTNTNVLGFNNGVYDFNQKTFRAGVPEDLVSMTTGYNFTREEDVKDAEQFLRDIVDEETYPCLLGLLAGMLRGGNAEQRFNFWVGGGGNGKSLLKNAVDTVFGSYSININKELYTKEKKSATGGEPEIVKMKGTRVGIVVETDDTDIFQVSVFKRTSGGDTLTARNLFSNNPITFTPLFKPVLMTNHLPKFSSSLDDGMSRRLRIFQFPYKFVDCPMNDVDENGREVILEKKRDYGMETLVKTPSFRNQLLNLLLNASTEYTESPSMVSARESYLKALNPVAEWFYECVSLDKPEDGKPPIKGQQFYRTNDPKDRVSTADLRDAYTKWVCRKPQSERDKPLTATAFGRALGQLVKIKDMEIDDKIKKGVAGFVATKTGNDGYDSDA